MQMEISVGEAGICEEFRKNAGPTGNLGYSTSFTISSIQTPPRRSMHTVAIIDALEAERDRLDSAIAALKGSRRNPGRPAGNGGKHRLSAAARKRISDAQKKRWAERKKTA
jgi:hypothetical protein